MAVPCPRCPRVPAEEHLDLDDGRWEDVHVITGALKLFFRELPEPLVPFGHFDKFIAAISKGWGQQGVGVGTGMGAEMGMPGDGGTRGWKIGRAHV